MKSRKLSTILVMLLLLAPVLTACGPQTVDVSLTTYKITLSRNTASAGKITFHVHNDATNLKHEFVIFKTDLPEDKLPLTSDGVVDENGKGVTHIDEISGLDPGKSQDLTVDLKPGKYVFICNLDHGEQHYQHGMHVSFTVK